jgi:hypothetical protein
VVALQPILGLSNRLRAIASFSVLARRTGRDFRLSWVPSQGFSNEDLSDLVDNPFARVDEEEFASLCASGLCLHDAPSVSGTDLLGGTHPVLAYRGYMTVDALVGRDAVEQPAPGFLDEYQAALTAWRPVPVIAKAVDEIAGKFDATTVGLHARRGDALVSPHLGWKYRISSDRAFFAHMDNLLRADSRTTFFLATDDAATEQRFRARYGDALHTNPAKRFVPSLLGQPKENQYDAVIDLFALAHTQRILGNHGSTFSSLAASIGAIPLQRVADKSLPARVRRRISRLRHR